jgi:DNA-binding MarR family transcriptional regulator
VTDFKLDEFLPYQLAVLSTRVSAGFARYYRREYGISVAEWRVVAHLSQDSSVSVREIGERVGMDKPKVSRAASRLEAAGYLSKSVNKTDRRLVRLSLTRKGREMIEALAPVARRFEAEIIQALGTDGPGFRDQINRLNQHLSEK